MERLRAGSDWAGRCDGQCKSVADAGAEACEVDQFGQSMARGHVIEVSRLAPRLEGRSSWCVKETLGTWWCCYRQQGCRGTDRRKIQRSSRECDASSLWRASSTPGDKCLHQDGCRDPAVRRNVGMTSMHSNRDRTSSSTSHRRVRDKGRTGHA